MAALNKHESQLADGQENPLIGVAQTLVADPSGGATVDAEARTAINAILDMLEEHGLMKAT